ncbi:MAG: hypothetical protein ACP5QG_07125, partial [candidate division WOR-3 bacterium]
APCPREQASKRDPLKNPFTRAFAQGFLLAMMRLSDMDRGQTGIFQGFHRMSSKHSARLSYRGEWIRSGIASLSRLGDWLKVDALSLE